MAKDKKRLGRSRGKRTKKSGDNPEEVAETQPPLKWELDAQPQQIGDNHEYRQYDGESTIQRPPGYQPGQAFYGYVEPDIQQYFKNVEATLEEPKFETIEEQHLFIDNVYSEVENRELVLATDHGCSLVLEKLLRVSPDFELRVFFDKLNGRFNELFTHRFASHVCQTLLTLAADVVERECKGESKPGPGEFKEEGEGQEDLGELLSMEKLFLAMCEQLQPSLASLISDSYASHIIRVILHVLAGRRPDDEEGEVAGRGTMRSKKSAKYNEQHNNTAVKVYKLLRLSLNFNGGTEGAGLIIKMPEEIRSLNTYTPPHFYSQTHTKTKNRLVPTTFTTMLRTMTNELISGLSETVMRALAVHQVASPTLQLLLELQTNTDDGEATRNLLINRILWGIASPESE
ncbi:armadillo-type protein [Jimgerdemannia flammicorona]|uniref:Nucleolar protein 9 n=1 Tax=Jimgerdemannia flammicorona TaxID=994334 RepID=A0A433A148_9FUNG|nr:armadillo-type protein [Jimgerdemannia flammicorona]